ncbi:bifunctional hydroxymethylpyrimidine kinase/phosphomethylpyrimidine kinase [Pedobacter frigidisoli]|uniref:bifunctional hydroxymethylpyrimidine kinase/phosphomethylpyrimidine kinase n=1 Tax=Pedobacter frigidisoli TaxID=2530455 RepID=UPI00292F8AFD|nr:bifunctional hydroxymethylpyrimidine kinase/phosphomethylpyrimidine kinase [Pedobacter frigidisoli]
MFKEKKYIGVLTIAGSDSGGGAGIQADLKTFSALGCYGCSVITAVTAQNTLGVSAVHAIPLEVIKDQLVAVMDDIKPQGIKIGMLNTSGVVAEIAHQLGVYCTNVPVILDPVMVATSGDRLMEPDAVRELRKTLFPLATLITPNIDEAEVLTGMEIVDLAGMILAGKEIVEQGAKAVLIKGGHLSGDVIYDVLVERGKMEPLIMKSDFIQTRNLHGTGCTLSSAIASEMAKGAPLTVAIERAKAYISDALNAGRNVVTGKGNGPLNHFFNPLKLLIT